MNKLISKLIDYFSRIPSWIRSPKVALDENAIISVKDLNITFKISGGFLHAIRGIDLEVRKGEIIGIVGESGSGKSVTVKTLLGFNEGAKVTAEHLDLLEYDLTSFNKGFWKYIRGNQIGYIPQDPLTSLNPVHRIGQQLKEAYLLGLKRQFQLQLARLKKAYWQAKFVTKSTPEQLAAIKKEIVQIRVQYHQQKLPQVMLEAILHTLKFIGIKNPKNAMKAYPHQFSGGMRQRIVIAQVILAKPRVIIADEPTTALDVIVQAKVFELLKQINQEQKITIILISHNIGLVANFCDYIYIMYAGQIVEKGPVYNLFTNPRHPYTWSLILAIPDSQSSEELATIPGIPPNLLLPPLGDAFAARNKWAMAIDFEVAPPMFKVAHKHYAATWLLHENSPMKTIPTEVVQKLKLAQQAANNKQKQYLAKQNSSVLQGGS